MSIKDILLIFVFLSAIVWSYHFFGRWRSEESYNLALAGRTMPDKNALENLDSASYFLEGFLSEEKGDLDSAEENYLFLIGESDTLHKPVLFNLANVYVKKAIKMGDMKMLGAAIEYYKAALRIDYEFLEAKYNLDLAMRFLANALGERAPQEESEGDKKGRPSLIPFTPGNI